MFDLGKALYGQNLIGIVATFVLYALAHDTLRSVLSLPGDELAFAVVVFLGFVMLIGSLLGTVLQLLWWGFSVVVVLWCRVTTCQSASLSFGCHGRKRSAGVHHDA
jgi:hypothetical protein